jgi:hypothetical protein
MGEEHDAWLGGIGVTWFQSDDAGAGATAQAPEPTQEDGTITMPPMTITASPPATGGAVTQDDGTIVMPPDTITASPPDDGGATVQDDGTIVMPPVTITPDDNDDPVEPWTFDPIDPSKKPPPNLNLPPNYVPSDPDAPGSGQGTQPGPPGAFQPDPPALPQSDPLEDALNRDPILRSLPKFARNAIKDAVKNADETLADKALDTLQTDSKTKSSIKAAAKAFLQAAKGKKWTAPNPPSREPAPSVEPPMPKPPGEVIIPGPKIDF